MSIEGQGHFFTIYFPGFVCFVLYLAKISGERLQDHWSSGFFFIPPRKLCLWEGILFSRCPKVRPSDRPTDRVSETFCFFNNFKNH